jgi:hypothetical protein
MDELAGQSRKHAIRNLLLLAAAFVVGIGCTRWFRFSSPALNYAFGFGLLCVPFLAFRPLLQLPRIAKVLGIVTISPLLILCMLMAFTMATCDFDLHPYSKGSCLQDLQRVEQGGYTIHLIQDECGGPLTGTAIKIEQRMRILPGLYVVRNVDYIDRAAEGQITAVGANEIHVHIPKEYGLPEGIERTYALKRHVYF